MFGENLFKENLLNFNLKRPNFGESFITLDSNVVQDGELELLSSFKSFQINIDNIRPKPEGEARCKSFKIPKSAKFLKGFVPVFTGYNGDNGLIRQISVHSCQTSIKLRETGACEADVNDYCSQLIFLWTPGTEGEMFPEGSGLQISETEILVLKISYNPGTGWLYDSSGMKIHYTSSEQEYQVGKVLITAENGIGICPKNCLRSDMSLVSLSLLSDEKDSRMILSSNNQTILQSGFTFQYQPIRHLPQSVLFQDLQLNCVHNQPTPSSCKALLTYMSKVSNERRVTMCGTDSGKSTYCTTNENEKTYTGKIFCKVT